MGHFTLISVSNANGKYTFQEPFITYSPVLDRGSSACSITLSGIDGSASSFAVSSITSMTMDSYVILGKSASGASGQKFYI